MFREWTLTRARATRLDKTMNLIILTTWRSAERSRLRRIEDSVRSEACQNTLYRSSAALASFIPETQGESPWRASSSSSLVTERCYHLIGRQQMHQWQQSNFFLKDSTFFWRDLFIRCQYSSTSRILMQPAIGPVLSDQISQQELKPLLTRQCSY